ncbi:MAG: YqgE/AlgH family protein [Pseudomonadales bacterium]
MPGGLDLHLDLGHRLLLAMPSQAGGYFADTVTYICRHNSEGTLGLIINQPLDLSFDELLGRIGIHSADGTSLEVLAGGPVREDQGLVLHSDDVVFPESDALGNGLCLTLSSDILKAIAEQHGPAKVLFTLGYAGWGAGQLEAELEQHAWLSLTADQDILFAVPAAQRLAHAQALSGADLSLLGGQIGHA